MLTPHMSWLGGRAVPPRTCPPTGAWASLADIMPTRPRNPVHRKAPKHLFALVLPRQLPQVGGVCYSCLGCAQHPQGAYTPW